MKKTKILTVLGVLLAMGITACGGNKASSKSEEKSSQSQPASSVEPAPASSSEPASTPDTSAPEQGSSSSSSAVAHVHVWNLPNKDELEEEFAEIDPAPTCTEAGTKTWYCECGETKQEAVKKLGHEWGEWAEKTAATCEQDGVEERECSRCHEKEERAIKAAHTWGEEQTVAAGAENQVSYKLQTCSVCGAYKATVKAVDCSFVKGSIKSGTPSGYFKLNSKNDKAIWRFNVDLPEGKLLEGRMYQIGAMDSYSSNTDKSYASTSTSGDNAPEYTKGNFDVVVNGQSLDKREWIRITFEEFLKDGEDSSAMGDNYSPLCLCPIGDCYLVKGANEMTYERLGSYNLIISDLVFIGKVITHEHTAAAEWSSDENQHWHACTVPGCPTAGKADTPAAHTFEDKAEDARNKAATCAQEGAKVEKCSVCGYEKVTPIAKIAHTYPNDGAYTETLAPTHLATGLKERTCSACNQKDEVVVPKLDHTFGDAVENYPAGEGYIATSAYNCSVCETSALRWSARDFDTELSSSGLDLTHDGDKSVRFASGAVENKGGTEAVGSHIVYKVNVAAAQEKAGLAFRIKNTGGNNGNADVFGPITNDTSVGYFKNQDGTFTESTHRYGLKVNGVEYFLGPNSYGNRASGTGWFEWPVEFPLQAGVNTIDVFAYRGYRADMYEFELTGLPKVVSSHVHNGDATWESDDNNHWHLCTAEGCAIADGKYDVAAHAFGEVQTVTPATCEAKGAGTKTCSVCGKVVDVEIAALGHNYAPSGEVTVDGTKASQTFVCSRCSGEKVVHGAKYDTFKWTDATQDDTATLDGAKFRASTTYTLVVFNVPAAGTYKLTLPMKGSNGNGAKILNGHESGWNNNNGQGFSVAANGVDGVFLGDQMTYAQFFGEDQTAWVDCDFAEVALVEGYNVITIVTNSAGNRVSIDASADIVLAPKA